MVAAPAAVVGASVGLIIRRVDDTDGLNSSTWIPVVAPMDCNNISVSNREASDGLWICTDPTDAKTRLYVPLGAEQGFSVPLAHRFESAHFLRGVPAVYLKTVSGTGPIIICWL